MLQEDGLAVAAADPGRPAAAGDVLPRLLGDEGLVEGENGAVVGLAGIGSADPPGIGDHREDLRPDRLGRILQVDGVAVGFAHLPSVGSGQPRHFRQHRPGFGKNRAVEAVKTADDLPGQFDMGGLVLAHGDEIGLVEDDVGGLKDGITEKTIRVQLFFLELFQLFLEGGNPFEPGQRSDHR